MFFLLFDFLDLLAAVLLDDLSFFELLFFSEVASSLFLVSYSLESYI